MPSFEMGIANITDFESLPAGSGWYGWLYIPEKISQHELSLLRQIQPEANINHYFHMSLTGLLSPLDIKTELPALNPTELQTFKSLHLAFAPCLYIGISRTLKVRLHRHRKHIYDGLSIEPGPTNNEFDEKNLDSEKESTYFGYRIAKSLRQSNARPENLYVKYSSTKDERTLKSMETLMNVSFGPILGRKP